MQKRTFAALAGVVMLVAVALPAAAQGGRGRIVLTGVAADTSVEFEINGTKPPGSNVVSSGSGVAEMTLDFMAMGKPEGFKAQVFVDVCRNGVVLRLVTDGGAVPPSTDDCTRRSRGVMEFRPDALVRITAARPLRPLPTALLGGGIAVDDNELKFTAHVEEFEDQVRTQTFRETVSEIPTNFEMALDTTVSAPQLIIPLGPSAVFGRNVGFGGTNDGAAAGRPRLVTHHAIVAIGRGEATLDFHNTSDPAASVRWNGSGTVWGLGYGALVEVCDGCGWFANASYLYSQMRPAAMNRSRPLETFGGTITRDDASFEWGAHRVEATIGKAIARVYPYLGVRTTVREATLKGNVHVDFSSQLGFTARSNVSFTNAFENTAVQALAGAQVQIPRTRLFVRAEGAAGGGGAGFGLNIGYGWY